MGYWILLTSTCSVFLSCMDYSLTNPLNRRVDILEREFRDQMFRMMSDLLDLEERLESMNGTRFQNVVGPSGSSDFAARFRAIELKIDKFIASQSSKTAAMSRAISDEKDAIRKILNVTKELAESNAQSVLEIKETIALNEAEIQNFNAQMKEFNTSLKAELEAVKNDMKLFNERIVDMDGTMIIQGFPKQPPCPKDWFRNKDTCYLFDKEKTLSWFGATIMCHDLGGKLAEPDTEEKMKYVLGTIDVDNVWIGGTDDDTEGTWMWQASQKLVDDAVLLWQSGQPNNLFQIQNCMEIGMSKLNDENCFEQNLYLCEKPVSE